MASDDQIHFTVGAGALDSKPMVLMICESPKDRSAYWLDPALAARLSASLAAAVEALKATGIEIDASKVRTNFYANDTDN